MEQIPVPHVVFLPYPVQGHIKPMMKLAEILSHEHFQVTFINTEQNHDRILGNNTDIASFCNRFPEFQFRSIPNGPPSDSLSSGLSAIEIRDSKRAGWKPAFRELLISLGEETGGPRRRRPTCIVADGIMSSVSFDAAEELEIPVIVFRTTSASYAWTLFHFAKLLEEKEIPFPDENMDKPITSIPGFEKNFRYRDLPSVCRVKTSDDYCVLQFLIEETSTMTRASALILNTCNEIEASIISRIGFYFSNIYTIGSLHELSKLRKKEDSSTNSISSNGILLKEDKSCMTWLDSQPLRSVLYVSFGSLLVLNRDQVLEFLHGIVNSGKRFLLVLRFDLISGESGSESKTGFNIPMELEKAIQERGFIVGWAPQEEVLVHPAIGGFLTHSGWNSIMESIAAEVPMICWPGITDQYVNSRCVSEVWKVGFDMKDTCDRSTIEKLVRDLMENKREEITASMGKLARMAHDAVKEGGSSDSNLKKLIQDIRSIAGTIGCF